MNIEKLEISTRFKKVNNYQLVCHNKNYVVAVMVYEKQPMINNPLIYQWLKGYFQ